MISKPTRRDFLAKAAVLPAIGPILLGVQDKTGARPPILGEGAHTYEAIHDWGQLPPHIKWGNTHNVVEDAQGHIYVHHTVHATSQSGDSVVVFDRDGRFVRSFGREYRGVAHGIWLRREGNSEFLYFTENAANARMEPQPELPATVVKATLGGEIVADLQTRVTLLDRNNAVILHLGDPSPSSPPNPNRGTQDRSAFVPGQFVNPHGAMFDREGNIFVAEWVEIGRLTKLRRVAA